MGQFKNLFIVEPIAELNEAYRAAFESYGVQVQGFATLAALLAALEEVLPDAVVIDHAAIVDGPTLQALLQFRSRYPQLPVYLTTTSDIRPEEAWEWSVNGVFYKPFRINQVLTQLILDLNGGAMNS